MDTIKDGIQLLEQEIEQIKRHINAAIKYKGNTFYNKKLERALINLNRSHRFLKARVDKTSNDPLISKFKNVTSAVTVILSEIHYNEKLTAIASLEKFWPELEIEVEELKSDARSFEIPKEIPLADYRLDLEEAIKDFDNGCFLSSLVMCRRAYEGSLVALYKAKTSKDPIEPVKCKHCKQVLYEGYIGIAKLHAWAIANTFITDKLKQVGFLLTDMGAGAAHPPLKEFPRDEEMARLGITATLALLKEIHSDKR